MKRCGFDSYQLKEGKDVEAAIACMDTISVTYQGASDDAFPIYRRLDR